MKKSTGLICRHYDFAQYMWGILLVIATLSQAVIPAGMMPDFSADNGVLKLVICSGAGTKTIEIPAENNSVDHNKGGHVTCPT